jgi:3-methyl-2-oxobutanoate hydroxymethyltransferase
LNDLRAARQSGTKVAVLTCYDFTTARLMQEAGVPALLVGDSAASVILGYPTTLPVPLEFMIEITAAVRRGAPTVLLIADMPFGSYQRSDAQGVKNVARMLQKTGCDLVKLEVAAGHAQLVRRLADAGVAVMAHIGLRPQTVGLVGGYRFQGRTADEARQIVSLATKMRDAGAAALLLEAVPPEIGKAVVDATDVPVIGCGGGAACHGHVVVTHDAVGLSPQAPRFVPELGNVAEPLKRAFADYVRLISSGTYPTPQQQYELPVEEKAKFVSGMNEKSGRK